MDVGAKAFPISLIITDNIYSGEHQYRVWPTDE